MPLLIDDRPREPAIACADCDEPYEIVPNPWPNRVDWQAGGRPTLRHKDRCWESFGTRADAEAWALYLHNTHHRRRAGVSDLNPNDAETKP